MNVFQVMTLMILIVGLIFAILLVTIALEHEASIVCDVAINSTNTPPFYCGVLYK